MDSTSDNSGFRFIKTISHWLDDRFHIPGTRLRFGLDPVLGLIPVAGDILSYFFSAYLILLSAKYGVSGKVMVLMVLNIFADTVAGSIPVIGQIFDFGYMANLKNLELLRKHHEEGKYQGTGKGLLFLIFFMLIIGLAVIVGGIAALLYWFLSDIKIQ